MVDYRGFGKSTGYRSQEAIKMDLQLIYDKIKEQVSEKRIILYGRSMGSGFATKLASANNPKMLILDAPYYSLTRTTKRYMPFLPISLIIKYPIPTYKWIKYVKCPIHIIHGSKDRLIPFKSSVELAAIANENSVLHTVIGGGHNNLHTFKSYHEILNLIFLERKQKVDIDRSSITFTKKKRDK
jgi:fermentation-respiration switch protein FrsA (DUF1100 family)